MKVLRAFDYSHDGVNAKHLNPGDDPSDVPTECLPGLMAEGYIGEGAPESKVVEAAPETGDANAFDHDGDGKPGGSLKGGRKKPAAAEPAADE